MIVSNRSNRNRTPTTSSEDLFLCFTSRLTSSSMKISSKSHSLNPVHSRDHSLSLSRRLKKNGIMKLGGKNRGSGFENPPEPSSPKVTCIGQVRIKSKKALSNQSFQTKPSNQNQQDELGERNHSNQRWVHFPFSICEGLKAFGAEFSCLFQCRSPEKEDKAAAALGRGEGGRSSCGAVFGRWLVAVQDEEREDGETTEVPKQSNLRKHVFDDIDIEIEDDKCEGRLSICIPPKNALLLMRYRSDPVKMSNLENKLWESNVSEDDDDDDEEEEEVKLDEIEVCEMWVSEENQEDEVKMAMEVEEVEEQEERENPDDKVEIFEELHQEIQEKQVEEGTQSVVKAILERESEEEEDELKLNQEVEEEEVTQERSEPEEEDVFLERESEVKKLERESSVLPDCLLLMMREKFKREKVKLSMEVSEETWVSTTDFIRWLPERAVKGINNGPDGFKNPVNAVSNPTLPTHPAHHQPIQQPPRSSCSFPAPAPAVVAVVEQKLVNAVAYEPFALTRCKSAPMRTAAKLAPEKCFWKDSKLEQFGIGAAGVGF